LSGVDIEAEGTNGLYVRAFCLGMNSILDNFRSTVVGVEKEMLLIGELPTLASITASFQQVD
jgi:hypothetical protein